MRVQSLALVVLAPSVALTASSCGGGMPAGCDRFVGPGGDAYADIQGMFEAAQPGETLCIGPGNYRVSDGLAIRDLDGVTIRGTGATRAEVVIDFRDIDISKGVTAMAMTDFTFENMTLLDAPGDNFFIGGSERVTIRDVRSGWENRTPAGRYALYPVESTDVLIERSEAFGSADAGIYVGQTTNCIVRDSTAVRNVAGIEIENSINCEVVDNIAEDNTGGILVFELPGLRVHGSGTLVQGNTVRNNNRENFAEEGTIVSFVPDGTGIMLLAANDVELRNNTIEDNDSTGILAISFATAELAGLEGGDSDPEFDPWAESTYVHGNTFGNNGTDPAPLFITVTSPLGIDTLEDVIFDGFVGPMLTPETTFCMQGSGTFRNADFDAEPGMQMSTTDLGAHACMIPEREPVMLPQDRGGV
ncbi:MAG: right-handed parallel beta-helix repeat-containing protein [Deltaproteobacteria bacterium]|nr:right-handed parallel beta-helix repeat-containing protein [Deltaproteobacteria bacterium]